VSGPLGFVADVGVGPCADVLETVLDDLHGRSPSWGRMLSEQESVGVSAGTEGRSPFSRPQLPPGRFLDAGPTVAAVDLACSTSWAARPQLDGTAFNRSMTAGEVLPSDSNRGPIRLGGFRLAVGEEQKKHQSQGGDVTQGESSGVQRRP
jgi:hypothetical protein